MYQSALNKSGYTANALQKIYSGKLGNKEMILKELIKFCLVIKYTKYSKKCVEVKLLMKK